MIWTYRHRWERDGDILTGPRGGTYWLERCIHCGQRTTSRRKEKPDECTGPERMHSPRRYRGPLEFMRLPPESPSMVIAIGS